VYVRGDAGQIEQALLNLCLNARDAMTPVDGTLGLRVGVMASAAPPVDTTRGASSLCCAFVEVSDTGVGIPPEVAAHLFEAFFTTKSDGDGHGLALAMVDAIARDHGGSVDFRSAPGAGTTFRVFLPLA
jgi:two-component system cell cycle sensor histidine kinase/response regulator CckA